MLFCCCDYCWLTFARWSYISSNTALGCIPTGYNEKTRKWDVNVVTITGGPIVPRTNFFARPYYGAGFIGSGPAIPRRDGGLSDSTYKWPYNCRILAGGPDRPAAYWWMNYVALDEKSKYQTYRITFSQPVTKVFMPIISLGAYLSTVVNISVTWLFSLPIRVISSGPSQFGECDTPGNCFYTTEVGNYLVGREGNGIIEISHPEVLISTLSFTVVTDSEYWNGFSIGLQCSYFNGAGHNLFPDMCAISTDRPPYASDEKTGNPLP